MPTVFILLGFRFSFYSNDHEPIHIHVFKEDFHAKYNLIPSVELVKNDGFKKSELKTIEGLITENREIIIASWNEFFNNN